MEKYSKYIRSNAGVTLIELLVVIVILGIVAAVVIPIVMGNQADAYTNTNVQNLKIIENAIARYQINNNNQYPDDLDDLTEDTNGGPYLPSVPEAHLTTGGMAPFVYSSGVVSYPGGAYQPDEEEDDGL